MEIANESVFVSAIRSFCKVFFACIALFLAFFVAMILYSAFASPYSPVDKTTVVVLPNLNNETDLVSFGSPVVLRINIDGVIGTPGVLDTTTMENILRDSRRGMLAKDRVKAVLLHLNTPGGSGRDSDNMYRLLKAYKEEYKVPVYAYVDGFCASGGMFISAAADRMYASPPSVIGSVGVIWGPFFNVSEALARFGVQSKTLTEGADKDTMTPFRPWKPDEGADLNAIMASSYQRFVDIVAASHPRLDKTKLMNEYGAKVFDAQTAEKLGYIDVADAEYKTALKDLLTAANIDAAQPYQVIELTPKVGWISPLSNQFNLLHGKIEHTLNVGGKKLELPPEPFSYYFDPSIR